MRNLLTGIFTVLAGTALFYGKQALVSDQGKSRDQIKTVHDSTITRPQQKTPAPLEIHSEN